MYDIYQSILWKEKEKKQPVKASHPLTLSLFNRQLILMIQIIWYRILYSISSQLLILKILNSIMNLLFHKSVISNSTVSIIWSCHLYILITASSVNLPISNIISPIRDIISLFIMAKLMIRCLKSLWCTAIMTVIFILFHIFCTSCPLFEDVFFIDRWKNRQYISDICFNTLPLDKKIFILFKDIQLFKKQILYAFLHSFDLWLRKCHQWYFRYDSSYSFSKLSQAVSINILIVLER